MVDCRHLWAFFCEQIYWGYFDASSTLYSSSVQPKFDSQFSMLISNAIHKSLAKTVVHIISQDSCLCQLTASRHIHEVKWSEVKWKARFLASAKQISQSISKISPVWVIFSVVHPPSRYLMMKKGWLTWGDTRQGLVAFQEMAQLNLILIVKLL